jgi:hypothetical protein
MDFDCEQSVAWADAKERGAAHLLQTTKESESPMAPVG